MKLDLFKNTYKHFINIIVTVLVGVSLILVLNWFSKEAFTKKSGDVPLDIFVQLVNGKSVSSPLVNPVYGEQVEKISILFATNGRTNQGEVLVELLQDETVLETWTIDSYLIPDVSFYDLRLKSDIVFVKDYNYSLRITNNFEGDNNIAVGMAYGNAPVTADGSNCEGQTICAATSYFSNQVLSTRTCAALSLLVIASLVFLSLKTKYLELPTYKILIVGLILIGLIIAPISELFKTFKTSIPVRDDPDISLRQSINPNEVCEFEFSSGNNRFVTLGFHVYGDNKSEYLVTLINKTTGTTYFANSEISMLQRRNLTDVAWMTLDINSSLSNENTFAPGEYVVSIVNTSPSAVLDIGITDVGNEMDSPTIAVCLIERSYVANYIALASIAMIVAYAIVIGYLMDKNKLNSFTFFLVTVIPLSLIYLVVFQVANVPDAEAHFVSSYHLSNALLGISGDSEWMARACDAEFFQNTKWWPDAYSAPNPEMRTISYAFHHLRDATGDASIVPAFPVYGKMKYYSALNWLPQALGLTMGRLLGLNSMVTIYLGRVCILAFYIFACARAIKNTPVGKFIICAIALLPVNLMLSSSFSYDCMYVIASLSFVAIVLRLRKEVTYRTTIEAVLWAFLLGSVKGGGALVLLPLVFILVKKDKKSLISVGSVLLASLFAVLLFNKLLAPEELFQFGIEGDGKMQAGFALNSPLEYLRMCSRTYSYYLNTYVEEILGSSISWLESVVPSLFVYAIAGVAIAGGRLENELKLVRKDYLIMLIPIIISLVSTPAMLLSYTRIGSSVILGIQGRYYTSILPLMLILFTGYFDHDDILNANYKNRIFKVFAPLMGVTVYYILRLYLIR